jgi:hypothetical protein
VVFPQGWGLTGFSEVNWKGISGHEKVRGVRCIPPTSPTTGDVGHPLPHPSDFRLKSRDEDPWCPTHPSHISNNGRYGAPTPPPFQRHVSSHEKKVSGVRHIPPTSPTTGDVGHPRVGDQRLFTASSRWGVGGWRRGRCLPGARGVAALSRGWGGACAGASGRAARRCRGRWPRPWRSA